MPNIFIHIPKAGGTTFIELLKKNYKDDEIYIVDDFNPNYQPIDNYKLRNISLQKLLESDQLKPSIIFGHFFYPNLSQQSYKYFSIIREPIERIVSEYYFVKNSKYHPSHEIVINENLTIVEYAKKYSFSCENFLIKIFSGIAIGNLRNFTDEEIFKKAYQNSDKVMIGTLNHYNKTLSFFKRIGFLNKIHYQKKNIGKYLKTKITNEEISVLNELNKYDLKFYDFIERKFLNNYYRSVPWFIRYLDVITNIFN